VCVYAGMGRLHSLRQLLPKQYRQQLHVVRLKAEVPDSKVDAVRLLCKKVFMEQSFPCFWDNRAVKLYIYPREETACQHEFKTNSEVTRL